VGVGEGVPSPIRKKLMLYDVATVTVRVVPRSQRTAAERRDDGVMLRVRSPAEGGRATEEARRLLADALGVPQSAVTLRTGARSKTKVFEIEGLSGAELAARLGVLPSPART
jgi:uncharacterized protein